MGNVVRRMLCGLAGAVLAVGLCIGAAGATPTQGLAVTWGWGDPTYDYAGEHMLDQRVDAVVSQICTKGMSDYEKVLAIHDYICEHVEYETYLGYNYHTVHAYDAMMKGQAVCSGYSDLAMEMLEQAGIECEYVSSKSMNHGWNIVKLGSYWYWMDVTFDDSRHGADHDNFLVIDHFNSSLDAEFKTSEFRAAHPMGPVDYGVSKTPIPLDAAHFPDANLRECLSEQMDTNGDGKISPQEQCDANYDIDVSGEGIRDLTGIELFGRVDSLDCSDNELTSLDLGDNPLLEALWCYGNPLQSFDISGCPNLDDLRAFDCGLTHLDLSHNPWIRILNVSDNPLASLNVSKLVDLKTLWCYNTNLKSLNLGNNVNLVELSLKNCNLTSLDLSACVALETVDVSDNPLTTLGLDYGRHRFLNDLNVSGTSVGEDEYGRFDLEYLNGEDTGLVPKDEWGEPLYLDENTHTRIYGNDRYATAIKAADYLLESLKLDNFDTVVVASGRDYADALSGSYLATKVNAPILLVDSSSQGKVLSYLKKSLKPGGTVYILGGTSAVSQGFQTSLKSSGFAPKRLGGENRFETNLKILREAGVSAQDEVLVCSGLNYADALSVSSLGKPIMLVAGNLTSSQKSYLAALPTKTFRIIGGSAAVSTELEEQLLSLNIDSTAYRIAGSDRFETSVMVAYFFFDGVNRRGVTLVYGGNFPDGLSGGPVAFHEVMPVVLVSNDNHQKAQESLYFTDGSSITLGGPKLISNATIRDILDDSSVSVEVY